jgi:UDP-GlcNAc:undecaprenyl-phosphate/decaprenyl-phosphate GlcNAc-1-phosphate transferase
MQPWLIFIIAAVAAFALTPLARAMSRPLGFLDDPGHRKIHGEPMALLGGVAVFAAVALGVLAGGMAWAERDARHLAGVIIGAAGSLALGLVDDKRDLKAAPKLVGQLAIALAATACGLRVTLFLPVPALHWLLTVLWLVTVMNALNFLDNMDGLCAGVGTICALIFGGIALVHRQPLAAMLAAATAGALLGFLPWNFPRATIFLGDSGSHLTGFLLGALALLPHYYTYSNPNPTALPVVIPLIVLALPLFDLVAVMWQRWRRGVPVYLGDTNHISHRFARLGLSRPAAVAVIYLLTLVLGLGAVELLWAPAWVAALVVIQTLGVLAVVTTLQHFGGKRNSAGN